MLRTQDQSLTQPKISNLGSNRLPVWTPLLLIYNTWPLNYISPHRQIYLKKFEWGFLEVVGLCVEMTHNISWLWGDKQRRVVVAQTKRDTRTVDLVVCVEPALRFEAMSIVDLGFEGCFSRFGLLVHLWFVVCLYSCIQILVVFLNNLSEILTRKDNFYIFRFECKLLSL